ncbi:DNA alkylation repair protein [bacterium]|nr:DNA alkylation repair protein [bacterium]
MKTVKQVLNALKKKGSEQTRKTFARHGAPDDMFGVKVADLKVIAKSLKGNQDLALELYDTGNCDAQYLAGMIADGRQMTKKQLETWAKTASWHMVAEYCVAWVASESDHAQKLADKWITAKKPMIASTGWCTQAGLLAITDDDDLDKKQITSLLKTVQTGIHKADNRVRYTMNGFVISVGSYYTPLLKQAKAAAKKIGKVEVDMNGTACKVPDAVTYIEKIEGMGRVGKKRKTIRC